MTRLTVRVHPRASRPRLESGVDGAWEAWLRSPPVDGRANRELIQLVAEVFDVPRSRVTIHAGATGRTKIVEVIDTPR